MDIINIIEKLFPSVLTAVIAAYLTARWSLRRYYSEKWWDRKEKAYSELIEAFYELMRYNDFKSDEYMLHKDHPKNLLENMSDKYKIADYHIKKATDIGAFVISKKAADALQEFQERPKLDWQSNGPFEVFEQEHSYSKRTLEKLKECALSDLRPKSLLKFKSKI